MYTMEMRCWIILVDLSQHIVLSSSFVFYIVMSMTCEVSQQLQSRYLARVIFFILQTLACSTRVQVTERAPTTSVKQLVLSASFRPLHESFQLGIESSHVLQWYIECKCLATLGVDHKCKATVWDRVLKLTRSAKKYSLEVYIGTDWERK